MNRLLFCAATLLFLALFVVVPTRGQVHPADSGAVIVETFSDSAPLYSTTGVEYVVVLWLLPSGNYDAQVSVSSLEFSGSDCSPVTTTPLYDIAEAVSDDAVAATIAKGYPACGGTPWSKPFRAWIEECGIRSGTGCGTSFSPASGTGWGYRSYGLTCAAGSVSVTQGGTAGDDCTGSESALYP